ncbi:g1912 [Coccomyxa viridis]|uniref:G1912 protein n=1 Tax=Coccomyxa viridis TaxID=1274662 RepID=A0ABP1FMY6_9CHLO
MFKMMEESNSTQAGGAGGGTTLTALRKADEAWKRLRTAEMRGSAPQFVQEVSTPLPGTAKFDVVMCGGTLGIFLACALQLKGLRVAVVERGPLKGRDQEWNISRKELNELVGEGLLTREEAEECIGIEFNPVRAGFHGGQDVWTRDVLNLGVRPDRAIAKVRERFEKAGGRVYEFAAAEGVKVHPNGVSLVMPESASRNGSSGNGASASSSSVSAGNAEEPEVSGRLLIDCMGNFSPIVRQARWGQRPDGVCLVVGSCCRGFTDNSTGDVIYTNMPTQGPDAPIPNVQYFWEAFPSGSGSTDRTTYLFTYIDADPSRPALESMLEDYWRLMPEYQNVKLEDLQPLRILFGFFPTYRQSPLKPTWNRVLQIGDASGIQSPLSFGGFGAMTRHLDRLREAVVEALEADALDKQSLALVNAYNPGLSGAWMLQRAMSVRPGEKPNPNFINQLLAKNFAAMQRLGDPVLKPFLQDVVQFGPMGKTLFGQVLDDPGFVPQIFGHVGIPPMLDWVRHFAALGSYTFLDKVGRPVLDNMAKGSDAKRQYRLRRLADAWRYGSGSDFKH